MQAVNSTMSDIVVACKNCHNLQCQLNEMIDYIARLTKSELWNIALYREQFHQQEREYEKDLQKIDADGQKIYEDQTVRLDNKTTKLEIAEQSLAHEFKCHRNTEKTLRDTKEALAYEQARNTKLFAIIQDALQHTLKELKEGEEEGDNNRELDIE
jgi:C4-dicarboxylate-specific signal transduction histidine kinase